MTVALGRQRERPPAVSGSFYPGDRGELAALVDALLQAVAPPAEPSSPAALIAPHAGYVYSGPTAAVAFGQLLPGVREVERVVLLGPAHFSPVAGLALAGVGSFATPLGSVPVDRAAERALLALPAVAEIPAAHAREHCLEVELPFLQTVLGPFRLVPLLVGGAGPGEVAAALEAVWDEATTLVVVSSDLSHYLDYDRARRIDRDTAHRILALEGPLETDRACGAAAINGLLEVARRRALRPRLLDLRSSGDTAGDHRRVVGYGAFAFA